MKINEIKNWYIEKSKLYFVSLELTQNCNFHCKHCYCADKEHSNMPLENFITIIDKLYESGCLFLNFTGGEILTYKYFKEVYTYAKEKGFIIDLLTNVSLIDCELIELFKRLPPNNIAITIYGTNTKEYCEFTGNENNYHKVMAAIRLLKDNNISFVLRTVASKTYMKSLMNCSFENIANGFNTSFKYEPIIFPKTTGDIAPLKECLSPSEIVLLEKNNQSRTNAWANIIAENKPFKWSCNAGINSFAIDHKGVAYVCGLYRNNGISILSNDISVVMQHLKSIHNAHKMIVDTNLCSKCELRNICKWCPAYSNIYNGNDYDKIDFFCELATERMKAFGIHK